MAEVLSAVMTGMPYCSKLLGMDGEDVCTPRHLGHFFVVIDPSRFVPHPAYEKGMSAYLADLRGQTARLGDTVMAPGDREWATEKERNSSGIPIAEPLDREFAKLADELRIPAL
jgi:LDH2 family malate/lactate/ureidoglycolate dehydrogenase